MNQDFVGQQDHVESFHWEEKEEPQEEEQEQLQEQESKECNEQDEEQCSEPHSEEEASYGEQENDDSDCEDPMKSLRIVHPICQ